MDYKSLSFINSVDIDVTKKFVIITLFNAETNKYKVELLYIIDEGKGVCRVTLSYHFKNSHFMVDVNKFFIDKTYLEKQYEIYQNNFSVLLNNNFDFELMSTKDLQYLFTNKRDELSVAIDTFNKYNDLLFKRPNCLNLISIIYMNGIEIPDSELNLILNYIGD
jgi:hypothetical protein